MKISLEKIAARDGRYHHQALRFVYEALGYTAKKHLDEPAHVSGQMLCEGLKGLALEKYGMLARMVLNTWGIKGTRDFGRIVFLMIENKWMSAQPTDSIEDFDDVYDFQTVFKDQYRF